MKPLGKDSDGMSSTNNLEKAYEELEKEIHEIKQKLQSSVNSGSQGNMRRLANSAGKEVLS